MAAKIRRDDEVVVITGKDKGRRGKVLQVRPDNPCFSVRSEPDQKAYEAKPDAR